MQQNFFPRRASTFKTFISFVISRHLQLRSRDRKPELIVDTATAAALIAFNSLGEKKFTGEPERQIWHFQDFAS